MDSIFKGSRIRLRAVEASDWEFFYALNDTNSGIGRYSYALQFPSSPDAVKAWTEKQALVEADNDAFRFQIEVLETGAVAGTVNTHNCNPGAGTFMYGIAIAPEHTRKGYASDAIKLLMRYYFEEKRYQKVTAEVYSFNEASIMLHERMSFTLEGRLRRMVYTEGQLHDALLYGMTREEFAAMNFSF